MKMENEKTKHSEKNQQNASTVSVECCLLYLQSISLRLNPCLLFQVLKIILEIFVSRCPLSILHFEIHCVPCIVAVAWNGSFILILKCFWISSPFLFVYLRICGVFLTAAHGNAPFAIPYAPSSNYSQNQLLSYIRKSSLR